MSDPKEFPVAIFLHEDDSDFSCVKSDGAIEYTRGDVVSQRVQSLIADRGKLEKQLAASKDREAQQLEAIQTLAGAGNVSPAELVQLGVGHVTENPDWEPGDDPRKRYAFNALDLEDLADMTQAAMHKQATVAKFRQLKQHFQSHQHGVTFLLNQLAAMARKNHLTPDDFDKLRDIRDQVSDMIGRTI